MISDIGNPKKEHNEDLSKIYSNGEKYCGQMVDGQRNGLGKMIFNNGDVYSGE